MSSTMTEEHLYPVNATKGRLSHLLSTSPGMLLDKVQYTIRLGLLRVPK